METFDKGFVGDLNSCFGITNMEENKKNEKQNSM